MKRNLILLSILVVFCGFGFYFSINGFPIQEDISEKIEVISYDDMILEISKSDNESKEVIKEKYPNQETEEQKYIKIEKRIDYYNDYYPSVNIYALIKTSDNGIKEFIEIEKFTLNINDWYEKYEKNFFTGILLVQLHSDELIVIVDGSFCETGANYHTDSEPFSEQFAIIEYAYEESSLNDGIQQYYTGNGCSNISVRTTVDINQK